MRTLLILSLPTDSSTTKVISWCKYLSNKSDVLEICPADFMRYVFLYGGCKVSIEDGTDDFAINCDIAAVWTRKWNDLIDDISSDSLSNRQLSQTRSYLGTEFNIFFQYFIHTIGKKSSVFWLNHPDYVNPNKLIQLSVAKEVGLAIPQSWVINGDVPQLRKLDFITKPLSNCFDFRVNKDIYTNYTSKLTGKETYDNLFFSFVQENIKKEAEIRVFYLLGKCYGLLIHSQDNSKTKVDYRNYDFQHENRLEPCQLPADITVKIDAFMQKINLQTGSLDFILTPNGEYIFLEVNPCGQYDIFNSCNIYPDKLIAEALISKL